jgi:hypothetical protein
MVVRGGWQKARGPNADLSSDSHFSNSSVAGVVVTGLVIWLLVRKKESVVL